MNGFPGPFRPFISNHLAAFTVWNAKYLKGWGTGTESVTPAASSSFMDPGTMRLGEGQASVWAHSPPTPTPTLSLLGDLTSLIHSPASLGLL